MGVVNMPLWMFVAITKVPGFKSRWCFGFWLPANVHLWDSQENATSVQTDTEIWAPSFDVPTPAAVGLWGCSARWKFSVVYSLSLSMPFCDQLSYHNVLNHSFVAFLLIFYQSMFLKWMTGVSLSFIIWMKIYPNRKKKVNLKKSKTILQSFLLNSL